jgi:hypothetical protein
VHLFLAFKKSSDLPNALNLMKIRAVGVELVHAGARTDKQTDGHDETNSLFMQFWERAEKDICSVVGCLVFPQEGRARYSPASVEGSVVTTAVDSPTHGHSHAACSRFEVQDSCTYLPLQAIPKWRIKRHCIACSQTPDVPLQ